MSSSESVVLFIEHEAEEVSDKPHCGDCYSPAEPERSEVTDKAHCGGC